MDTQQYDSGTQTQYRLDAREGARLTVTESVRIGLKLQEARERPDPVPWKELSRRFGLPVRTLQYQWNRHQERRAAYVDVTGIQMLRQSAHLYEELLENALEIVETAQHPLVRIGAIRTVDRLLNGRGQLFGLTYEHSSFVARTEALKDFVDELRAFMHREDVPIEVIREIKEISARINFAYRWVEVEGGMQ